MRARLFCKTGELAGVDHSIGAGATIGRSAENTLVLGAPVISQTHARIFFDTTLDGYILEDLQSKNGTQLDGISVHGRERLRDLHVVTLGEVHDFIFAVLPEPADVSEPVLKGDVHRASDDPAPETVLEPPSALAMPSFEEAPGSLDHEGASGPETVLEPPSALAMPSFEEAPGSLDHEGASGPKTVLEPPSALAMPSFEEAPGSLDHEGASGPETVLEPPSALAMPSFEEAPGSLDHEGASGPETVLEPSSAVRAPRVGADPPGSDVRPAVEPMPDPGAMRPVLQVTLADRSSFRVDLADGVNTVGRGPQCQVFIDDRTLSRRHAVLTVEGDTVTCEDEGSRNGTFKDGVRLTAPLRLRVGDVLTFGCQVTARLVVP